MNRMMYQVIHTDWVWSRMIGSRCTLRQFIATQYAIYEAKNGGRSMTRFDWLRSPA